jgi:PEGA domain
MSKPARSEFRPEGTSAQPPPAEGADDSSALEFMSEDSPEVKAMWAPPHGGAVPAVDPSWLVPNATPQFAHQRDQHERHDEDDDVTSEGAPIRKLVAVEPRVVWSGPPVAPVSPPVPVTVVDRPNPTPAPFAMPAAPSGNRFWLVVGGVVLLGGAIAGLAVSRGRLAGPAAVNAPVAIEGSAMIDSRPAGAEVMINGVSRGTTPLKISLPEGTYGVVLQNGASTRSLTVTVDAATAVHELVDLPAAADVGTLDISSDVVGARVSIDGVFRGVTPITLIGLEPGPHRVGLAHGDASIFRNVTVTAGATASIMASVASVGTSGGWLTIAAPLELQVTEGGDRLGTTGATRIMLPAGKHELTLSSAAYDFRTTVTAQIVPGRTITIPVTVPNGTLSVNAAPWADVSIDGRDFGATPIGNISLPIGPHEVVWRHPQLGERRQTVAVGARVPARASMDLTAAR